MTSEIDTSNRAFGTSIRSRWNNFVGTPPGDVFAALLTIAVMFGAMFALAFATVLGMDGLQLILRAH